MQPLRRAPILLLLVVVGTLLSDATRVAWGAEAARAGGEKHGLSQKAQHIFGPAEYAITNSMVLTWVAAAGIIIFAQVATRRMKSVPDGAQNFCEWLVESLYGFLEGVIGAHLV